MQSVDGSVSVHMRPGKAASPVSVQDQTAFIHLRLNPDVPHAKETFKAWLAGILHASQQWRNGAWAGRLVLEAPNDYIVAFRFKTYDLMRGWLNSSARSQWLSELSQSGCAEQVSSDMQGGCCRLHARRHARRRVALPLEDRRRARWRTGCNPAAHSLGPPTEVEERPCDLALTPA